jgi:uncharacterized protein YnzC (UPF0291/DUF896 family)
MEKEIVERMLALARKKREEGPLTEQEGLELTALRQQYLEDFRKGFQQQLDNVYVQQEDGSYQKLQKKNLTQEETWP